MIVDLTPLLSSDFSYGYAPTVWDHGGKARVCGALWPNVDTAQTILPASGLPVSFRPSAPVSIVLPVSLYESWFPSSSGPRDYSQLDSIITALIPTTVYPDGSWTCDAPMGHQESDAMLHLVTQWALPSGLVADDPDASAWQSLAPLLTSDWTNIDAEYASHENTLHLRGRIQSAIDQNNEYWPIASNIHLPKPEVAHSYADVLASTDGYDYPVELEVGPYYTDSIYINLFGSRVPTSSGSGDGANRLVGGTFALTKVPASTDLTGSPWNEFASYPHYSWDSPPNPAWKTPWWTWDVAYGLETYPGFGPGPVASLPSIPSIDLAALIATIPTGMPDWVSIKFTMSANMKYSGYQTLDDAKADTPDGYPSTLYQNPQSPYAHGYRSAAMMAINPQVSGVSNRKFYDSNDCGLYGSAPAYTGALDLDFDEYYHMSASHNWGCYLAPVSPVYTRRKLVEPAGAENAQLLWRASDVTTGTINVTGEAQAGTLGAPTWTIQPFYNSPENYLIAGDVVTFTQNSWWPIHFDESPLIMFI